MDDKMACRIDKSHSNILSSNKKYSNLVQSRILENSGKDSGENKAISKLAEHEVTLRGRLLQYVLQLYDRASIITKE